MAEQLHGWKELRLTVGITWFRLASSGIVDSPQTCRSLTQTRGDTAADPREPLPKTSR